MRRYPPIHPLVNTHPCALLRSHAAAAAVADDDDCEEEATFTDSLIKMLNSSPSTVEPINTVTSL